MAKKRGRKSKRQYFTEDTEHAILEYLASEDQAEINHQCKVCLRISPQVEVIWMILY